MPIQRTYSLPSCTLFVEGISTGDSQIISILTHFECKFHDGQMAIAGGRNLLEALVEEVSSYTQLLQNDELELKPLNPNLKSESGVGTAKVRLELLNPYSHLLYVQPSPEDSDQPDLIKVQLGTVQLFDLIDSLDQLCLDSQTIPDLGLALKTEEIKPGKPNKFAAKSQPLTALIGVAGVAIAASAVIFLPPLFKSLETQPDPVIVQPTTKGKLPEPVLPLDPLNPSPPKTPIGATGSAKPDLNSPVSPSPIPEAIADPKLVSQLQTKLRRAIDRAWRAKISFRTSLTYVVAVNEQGEIVGYKPTSETIEALGTNSARQLAKLEKELPLKKLSNALLDPITGGSPAQPQPTASFLVTFSPRRGGVLTVEPLDPGQNSGDTSSPKR